MCHELVEDAEILALRKKIATKSEISPAIAVYADESYLRRILLNLLDNALKYNVEGGTVSISLGKADSLAIFRIANTGPEIPPEHENRIFERFYRADPSRSSDTVGSGLGLSICHELVLAHGGDIWLERVQPGWTAFALTLPGPKNSVSADLLRS
jgi:two-component system OmpR family sensor kinase